MKTTLDRIKKAQECFYEKAKSELLNGYKETHWIWFIFPQLKGIGTSFLSNYYGLDNLKMAKEYYKDKYLRKHLVEMCKIVLKLKNHEELVECFGELDTLKVHACTTLFWYASGNGIFRKIHKKFFDGLFHEQTVVLL